MSEFFDTAVYYSKYRPGIPREVAQRIFAEANRDERATTLLDLGTGTGQVIEAMHRNFSDIIGIDPDPEMLALAEKNVRPQLSPDTTLRLIRSEAERFVPPDGWKASLVTICRAFHWMDQPLVLRRFAQYTPQKGVVAVFGDRSFWDADNDWKKAVRRVVQSFLGEQRRAGDGVFTHHDRPYTEILRESPFSNVEEVVIPVRRTWKADSILGYLYSTSFASRAVVGDRVNEFEAAVRAVLAGYSGSDTFKEENEFTIRLGRKA